MGLGSSQDKDTLFKIVVMSGPTGTGKTACAYESARLANVKLIPVDLNGKPSASADMVRRICRTNYTNDRHEKVVAAVLLDGYDQPISDIKTVLKEYSMGEYPGAHIIITTTNAGSVLSDPITGSTCASMLYTFDRYSTHELLEYATALVRCIPAPGGEGGTSNTGMGLETSMGMGMDMGMGMGMGLGMGMGMGLDTSMGMGMDTGMETETDTDTDMVIDGIAGDAGALAIVSESNGDVRFFQTNLALDIQARRRQRDYLAAAAATATTTMVVTASQRDPAPCRLTPSAFALVMDVISSINANKAYGYDITHANIFLNEPLIACVMWENYATHVQGASIHDVADAACWASNGDIIDISTRTGLEGIISCMGLFGMASSMQNKSSTGSTGSTSSTSSTSLPPSPPPLRLRYPTVFSRQYICDQRRGVWARARTGAIDIAPIGGIMRAILSVKGKSAIAPFISGMAESSTSSSGIRWSIEVIDALDRLGFKACSGGDKARRAGVGLMTRKSRIDIMNSLKNIGRSKRF